MDQPIYLDHNATTPMLPEVVEAMREAMAEPYRNPSSQHSFGRHARRVLENARERIGELVGAKMAGLDADRVIFTSGGTEANNLAIRGLLGTAAPGRIVTSALEHPSVTAVTDHLARCGWQIDRLTVSRSGFVNVLSLEGLLRPNTRLVCAILGHNETGVIQESEELTEICTAHDVPLHRDAAQAAGKQYVSFRELGATTMSLAAHKFNGPLGIGALVVRHGVELSPQLFGGFQQEGMRPGTESVALAVGMCTALEWWDQNRELQSARLQDLRDHFETVIHAGWPRAIMIGAHANRLPHVSNIAFVGLDRQALFIALDQAGIACSTGSACASGSSEPSPAHLAMRLSENAISSALRFSLGVTTTRAEVDEAARRILNVCNHLRR